MIDSKPYVPPFSPEDMELLSIVEILESRTAPDGGETVLPLSIIHIRVPHR